MEDPTPEIRNDWDIYIKAAKEGDYPDNEDFDLDLYWKGMVQKAPILAPIARQLIWQRINSVDVERSFSQYKHVLTDRRESLTEAHTKQLLMLKYNGDIEG